MENLSKWLDYPILSNQLRDLIWFAVIIGLGVLIKKGLSLTISRTIYRVIKSESGSIPVAEFVGLTRRPFELLISLVIIFWAFSRLTVPAVWGLVSAEKFGWLMILERSFFTILAAAIGWLGIRIIKFIALIFSQQAAATPTPIDDQLVPFFKDICIILWTLTCFFVMLHKVYEVNVWALITSLGIGGLVIALAARETLENLIASVAIMLERPFVIGDTIVLDKISGDIEQIGFRSTRIRSDDGSLITVPNRLMTTQALENMTQRTNRRAKYYVRLAFDTPPETISHIIETLQEFFRTHPLTNAKEATVRLETLGEFSLDILVIYHVSSSVWKDFITVREEVNFKIIDIVRANGAEFAYPSRNLFVKEIENFARAEQ